MFKQLMEWWRGSEVLIDEIDHDFEEMLYTAHKMYDSVTESLFYEGSDFGSLKKEIYKQDSRINAKEQEIRRKIMRQLIAGGSEGPIASCLILMSISKDAERLGDYVKNILEVFEAKPELGETPPYYGRLESLKSKISSLFRDVHQAYHESDQKLAKQLVKDSYEYQKLCDENVKELLLDEPHTDRVAYALLTRFFKRILAHLKNIATSVYMPVDKIDYFDEKP